MSGNPSRNRGGGRASRGGGRGDQQLPFHPRGGGRGGPPQERGTSSDNQSFRGYRGGGSFDGGRGGRGGGGGFDRGRGRGRGAPAAIEVYQTTSGVPQPDAQVSRVENELENNFKLASAHRTNNKEARLPQRPGFGTRGDKVLLWANYLNMTSYGDLLLYRYAVDIAEAGGNKSPTGKKLKRVVQLLLEEHLASHGRDLVTDFKSNILSKTDIDLEPEYVVIYRTEGEDDPAPGAKAYRVRLQSAGTVTVSELMDYLSSTNASQLFGSKDEIIQALNIAVGYYPKHATHIANVGANKHFELDAASREKFDLGAGLTALRGFFVSVRAATARLLVNVQVKHAAFFNDGPLVNLMQAYMRENGPNRVKLMKFVSKVNVEVIHIVKTNKAGRRIPRVKQVYGFAMRDDGRGQEHPPIVPSYGAGSKEVKFFQGDDSAQKPASSSDAPGKKGKGKGKGKAKAEPAPAGPSSAASAGRYISVYDYFQQKYPSITIADPSLPVINVGSRQNPSYLPPDVCMVLPGQPSNAKLSPSQTQQMIRFAVRKPALNAQSIATNGVRLLGFEPRNDTLSAYGLNVNPALITVPGRVLASPAVKYKNKQASTRFGSWNMAETQFSSGTSLQNWTYLRISANRARDSWDSDEAFNATMNAFAQTLRNSGINAAPYSPGLRIMVDTSHPEPEIDEAFRKFASTPGRPPPRLVLVILPSTDGAVYNKVKYVCDVERGLLNVCVVGSKFARANTQYHANVALKVNLKLGGQNQTLDNTKLGIISQGKTMVVGIDVTHPSPGSSSNAPSVASIVASVDAKLAQWPADLRIQAGRKEMVGDLKNLFRSRLQLWKARNGNKLPENILVYRDGVSEGQYNSVLDEELPELQKASQELYPAPDTKKGLPHITIIIVGKRHHTRFYPTKADHADRSSNPQNGTVVDRGVTEARNWDFFLQAHTALQGTARPAHYYIVWDQIFQNRSSAPFSNAADVLEDLTHNLCYLYGRATKAVSICPPAYYADLACERARCYLSGLFDPSASSPGASLVSGQTGGSGQAADPNSVKLHDNVKDSMFYI